MTYSIKDKGGRPEVWDWAGVPPLLDKTEKERRKPNVFDDMAEFEEWLTDNVERADGSPRGDGPDKSTVQRAIARENLADKVIISRRERNPEAQA